MGQITNQVVEREKEKFPSQPVPNPKGQFFTNNPTSSTYNQNQVQSIITLRSGREIENQVDVPNDENMKKVNEEENQEELVENKESSLSKSTKIESQVKTFVPKAPYPHRLANSIKKSSQFGDVLELFKKVNINIPLLDAIQQVPSYAKFLKDL